MKTKGILSRTVALLLLTVTMHAYLCSAFCASGVYGCCTQTKSEKHHAHKSCCDKPTKGPKKDGCQEKHLAYFGTVGQFHSNHTVQIANAFPPVLAIPAPVLTITAYEATPPVVAFTGFHPPPPKQGVRVLIQSFLI